jgi:hypothetical protein
MNSARIAAVLLVGTQLAAGFSWMRISSGASIRVEKPRIGTSAMMPS